MYEFQPPDVEGVYEPFPDRETTAINEEATMAKPKRRRRFYVPLWELEKAFRLAFLFGGIATVILLDMWLASH